MPVPFSRLFQTEKVHLWALDAVLCECIAGAKKFLDAWFSLMNVRVGV